MPLDLSLLEKVRHHASGKVTSRCPACAETGGDRTGNHLVVFPDDRFACAAHGGDGDHRKRIMALAGIPGDGDFRSDPELREQWRERAAIERQRKHQARCLEDSVQMYRREIIRRHAWTPPDVWDDSPQRIDCDLVESDPAHFLATLYQPQDLLWTGEVHHSGSDHHSNRWRSCRDWQTTADVSIGPMTTPAVWQPGIHSRAAGHVLTAPYTVLDFDGFDGIKPATEEELDRHLLDSLGLIRWLREGMGWHLAAILWTGGKSLHAWFRTPPPEALASLLPVAQSLGMDAGLIGRPEHPCRLPGQRHSGTGQVSRVLWLDLPACSGGL
jgi:hypothetical protein